MCRRRASCCRRTWKCGAGCASDPALFIDDLVESLDLRRFEKRYRRKLYGKPALVSSDAVEAVASGGCLGRVQRAGAPPGGRSRSKFRRHSDEAEGSKRNGARARQRLAATPHPLFLQRTLVSRKRAKIGARAGPIWHYVALRGTTWHKAPPTCTRTCAFEGPLGSPRRAIQPSSREKTAHDLRVGELQWTPEDGENVTNRTVNAPLKTGQNEEIGNAAVRAASGERAARARLPITVIDRQSLGEALAGTVKLAFLERAGTRDRGLSSSQAAIVTASQMRKERPRSSR